MDDSQITSLVAALAPVIKGHVERATAPLLARIATLEVKEPVSVPVPDTKAVATLERRIAELESRAPVKGERGEAGPPGRDGADGKSVDTAELAKMLADSIAALPKPERGEKGEPGRDGRDAPSEGQIAAMVARAVSELPPPAAGERGADGRDGKDADEEAIAAKVLEIVLTGLKEIPAPKDGKDGAPGEKGEKGDPGEQGPPGKPVDPEEVGAIIDKKLREGFQTILKELPPPKDGKDGIDGKDADPELIRTMVHEAVAALPPAEPGPKGEKGEPGKDGRDGRDIDPAMVEKMVGEAVAKIPPAKDGAAGRDGVGLAGAMIDRDGNLVLTLSDGKTEQLGRVVGTDGKSVEAAQVKEMVEDAVKALPPPKDGVDGLGFDDLDVVENEQGYFLRFTKGERCKEFRLSVVRDRGVYKTGTVYNKGDGISFSGSFWIAQKDGVTEKPEGGDGWRLAVKRGRDRSDPVRLTPES